MSATVMLLCSHLCQGSPREQDELVMAHLSQRQCIIAEIAILQLLTYLYLIVPKTESVNKLVV